MITLLKDDVLRIVALLLIFAIILVVIALFQEINLRRRKKINYNNFEKFQKYYQLKINYLYLIGVFGDIIFSTYFAFITVRNPNYALYMITLVVLNLLLFPLIYLQISRNKYNKDLTIFSQYYYIIRKSYEARTVLMHHKQDLEAIYQTLLEESLRVNDKFSSFMKSYQGIPDLLATLKPISEIIKQHQEKLDAFDYGLINKFNQELNSFITTNQHNKWALNVFNYQKNYHEKDIQASITKAQNKLIYEHALTELKQDNLKSVSALMDLILFLESLKVNLREELIIEVLNYIYQHYENRTKILSLLISKGLISVNILETHVNVKDWSWVYEIPLDKIIEVQDAYRVFLSLIRSNAYNSAYNVLTTCDSKYSASIRKAAKLVTEANETHKLFLIFHEVYASNDCFNIKALKYENIAVVLNFFFKDYYPKDKDANKIAEILRNNSYVNNREFINNVYLRIQSGYSKFLNYTMNTLINYRNTNCDYINYQKLINQYAQYRKNLNIKELKVLDVILNVLILLNETNPKYIGAVFQNFAQIDVLYRGKISVEALYYDNRLKIGNQLLRNLLKYEINTVKKVVNQIENERLVFDKIVNL